MISDIDSYPVKNIHFATAPAIFYNSMEYKAARLA